jgi:hypothetical protein
VGKWLFLVHLAIMSRSRQASVVNNRHEKIIFKKFFDGHIRIIRTLMKISFMLYGWKDMNFKYTSSIQ